MQQLRKDELQNVFSPYSENFVFIPQSFGMESVQQLSRDQRGIKGLAVSKKNWKCISFFSRSPSSFQFGRVFICNSLPFFLFFKVPPSFQRLSTVFHGWLKYSINCCRQLLWCLWWPCSWTFKLPEGCTEGGIYMRPGRTETSMSSYRPPYNSFYTITWNCPDSELRPVRLCLGC